MEQQTNPLIVIGTHRSGTSVMAGCLRLLGVNIGRNLIDDNEFEQSMNYPKNSDIILIHDILLRDLGCRWDMIGTLPEDWLQSKAAETAREKIFNLMESDFAENNLWAISDPRLCKIFPLWLDVFSEKGLSPKIVLMVRHPYEVAASLGKQYGFDMLKGHLLWLSSNRQALAELRIHDHTVLTYDRLLADPVSCLETISHELNVVFPRSMADAYQDLITFIRPELKHEHNSHAVSGQTQKETFGHYAWLYDQFRIHQTMRLAAPSIGEKIVKTGFSTSIKVQNLAAFPLISRTPKAPGVPADTSHATEMFDHLLSLIRSYEQAELDTEIKRQRLLLAADHHEPMLYAQIFLPIAKENETQYTAENPKKILLAPEEWQKISVGINVPDALRQNQLCFEPLNVRGMIRIQSLSLINSATDQPVWSVPGSVGFDQCKVEGQAFVLDCRENLVFCATGNAPRVYLPPLPNLPDVPLRFEIWLKVGRNLDQIKNLWCQKEKHIEKVEKDIEIHRNQLDEIVRKHEQSQAERMQAREQLHETVQENEKLLQEWQEQLSQKDLEISDLREDLQQLQDKFVRQEDLTRQYFAEISKLEKVMQEKENQNQQLNQNAENQTLEVQRFREQVSQKDSEIHDLKKDLEQLQDKFVRQEDLTRQYFTELAKTERQLAFAQDRVNMVESQNHETGKLISRLRKDCCAIASSARWRLGNWIVRFIEILLFRKKSPMAIDHMQELLTEFSQKGKKTGKKFSSSAPYVFYNPDEIKRLNSWLRQLNNDYKLLKSSMRWKLGNVLIRSLELLAFKRRKTMAIDHLEQIFKEYQEQSVSYPVQNTKKLQSWLRQAKNDFSAIKNSMRWRTGARVFFIIDILLFRWKKQTAMDHALKIAAEYEKWENKQ